MYLQNINKKSLGLFLVLLIIGVSCQQKPSQKKEEDIISSETIAPKKYSVLPITSGLYSEGLLMANDSVTGLITGYYDKRLGWNDVSHKDRYTCIFTFRAHQQGDIILIEGSMPGSNHIIRGNLEILPENTIKIKLFEEPDDCGEIAKELVDEGHTFKLVQKEFWQEIRVVSSVRAYLCEQPDKKSKTQTYVKEGQGVCVLAKEQDWIKISYLDKTKKTVEGWLKISDVYSMEYKGNKSNLKK